MDSKPVPVYQTLEVHTEWVHEAEDDTLIVYIPGFKKEQIKVQVTSKGVLRIYGQRPLDDNKVGHFSKEFPIPSNCDKNKIRANFSGGILLVKHPKLIVPAEKQEEEGEAKPSARVPESDQKPAAPVLPPTSRPEETSPQKHKNGQGDPPKAPIEKETGEKKDGVANQADGVSSKAPDNQKEMKDAKNAASESDEKAMEKDRKDSDQEEKATTSNEMPEKLGDSFQGAAEKETTEPKIPDGTSTKYQRLGINYKLILDGLVGELKNPCKMMNTVLAVLLVLVVAVYIRNAIRSLGLGNEKN